MPEQSERQQQVAEPAPRAEIAAASGASTALGALHSGAGNQAFGRLAGAPGAGGATASGAPVGRSSTPLVGRRGAEAAPVAAPDGLDRALAAAVSARRPGGTLSRQPAAPAPPATSTPAAPAQASASGPVSATLEGTMTITPGGLAPGKERTQTKLFYGDKLTFRATTSAPGQGQIEAGVAGSVAAEAAAPVISWTSPQTVEMTVTVGRMGAIQQDPGQPPAAVEAKPFVKLSAAPATMLAEQTFSFRVIGDLQWLADRASIAGEQGEEAYLAVLGPLKAAFAPYKAAWVAHKTALENRDKRERLKEDILISIFLVGVAGAAGGAVQQAIRGRIEGAAKAVGAAAPAVETAAQATAIGDVTKYIVRLGSQAAPAPDKTPTAAPSTGGPAGAGAGFEPDLWLADREAGIADAGRKLKAKCVELRLALNEAWAQGKTDKMDQDPMAIVSPYLAQLKTAGNLPVKDQQEFSRAIWQNWLEQYGYTVKKDFIQWADVEKVEGKLLDDIKAQCGGGSEAMIEAALGTSRQAAIDEATKWNRDQLGYRNPEPSVRD